MNKKPFVTATVCRDLIPRVMSSAVVAGKKEVTMGKLKRKEQNVSSIWKVESLGYLALKGTESSSLGTLDDKWFFDCILAPVCLYCMQLPTAKIVSLLGGPYFRKESSRPYHMQNQLESITLAFIFFVVVLPNLFCQHMRDAKLNIQSSFAINFSCLL